MPKIYLAVDNCFASKRWTAPGEWATLVRDMGLRYAEASADTENDPHYQGAAFRERWLKQVKEARDRAGIRIANLYSGHGTYATLGLGHPDGLPADRMLRLWLQPQVDAAAELDAGFGFFTHAFPLSVLEDPEAYGAALSGLTDRLAALASYAAERMEKPVGVEQMYTPHQVPWTIAGAKRLLAEVAAKAGAPLYLTVDLGHQCAQGRHRRPGRESLEAAAACLRDRRFDGLPWLGCGSAYGLARSAAEGRLTLAEAWARLEEYAALRPYLYSDEGDEDTYRWLRELGPYSPIIHLQQTDGTVSAHWPFTEKNNRRGIIHPQRVLRSLAEGYAALSDWEIPPAEELFLTIEVFIGTAANPFAALEELRETAAYWRRWIPEDGLELETLIAKGEEA